jgi:lipopolysaccharide/colanic/teichoic acid biosynthesis glycosyltransferase
MLTPARCAKRFADVILATTGLLLLSPLIICVAVAIKLESRGPVFHRETVYGYANQAIQVFKFRLMAMCASSDQTGPCETRIGRVLRHTGIDEIPQLLNVLFGEMSIVGPRAFTDRQDLRRSHSTPLLENFKPGITGWTQLMETREGPMTAEQRTIHDLHYVEQWSLLLDIKILVMVLFSIKTMVSSDH